MCIPLLPDPYLEWLFKAPVAEPNQIMTIFVSGIAFFLLFLNVVEFVSMFVRNKLLRQILRPFIYFRLVNGYGLFVHMTRHRDEIIVEGSDDKEHWKAYEFKWKPDNPLKPPRFNIPHQPRLDWQMWFAALSHYRYNQWFTNFLIRLLQDSKDVTALLKINPFPDHPPKYIRSVVYNYHFSDLKIKRKTGVWWVREYKGNYTPVMSLQKKQDNRNPKNGGST